MDLLASCLLSGCVCSIQSKSARYTRRKNSARTRLLKACSTGGRETRTRNAPSSSGVGRASGAVQGEARAEFSEWSGGGGATLRLPRVSREWVCVGGSSSGHLSIRVAMPFFGDASPPSALQRRHPSTTLFARCRQLQERQSADMYAAVLPFGFKTPQKDQW